MTAEYYVPEYALVFAVLERAILDALGNLEISKNWMQQEVARSAIVWFRSNDEEPWTFLWVCNMLDLNPEHLRNIVFEQRIQIKKGARRWDTAIRQYAAISGLNLFWDAYRVGSRDRKYDA